MCARAGIVAGDLLKKVAFSALALLSEEPVPNLE